VFMCLYHTGQSGKFISISISITSFTSFHSTLENHMRKFAVTAAMILLLATGAMAQTKTTETKTTTDPESGKTTTTTSTSVSQSEDITPRTNMIVINPLKFFVFYNLSYYHALSNTVVIGGGVQMPTISSLNGFGVNAEVRLHPSGKALRGFYVAPNVSYNHLTVDGSEGSASAFSVGALVGWQWFPGDDFAMGLGIGADYYMLSSSEDDEVSSFSSYDGMAPALRFDIGYAW
jgi:hypothetical protein